MVPGILTMTVPGHGMPETGLMCSERPAGHQCWVTGMETVRARSGSTRMAPGTWTITETESGIPALTNWIISERSAGHR